MRVTKLLIATALAALLVGTAAQADVTISKKPTQNMSCRRRVLAHGGGCGAERDRPRQHARKRRREGHDRKRGDEHRRERSVGWTSTSRLTLDAIQSVEIDKPVMVTGTGAVTVTTNDGGTGGDLIFDGKGNVTFWDLNSSLIVNGNSYMLVGNIATLASDIANNPSGFYALANDYAAVGGWDIQRGARVADEFFGTFEGLGHTISKLEDCHHGLLPSACFSEANGIVARYWPVESRDPGQFRCFPSRKSTRLQQSRDDCW